MVPSCPLALVPLQLVCDPSTWLSVNKITRSESSRWRAKVLLPQTLQRNPRLTVSPWGTNPGCTLSAFPLTWHLEMENWRLCTPQLRRAPSPSSHRQRRSSTRNSEVHIRSVHTARGQSWTCTERSKNSTHAGICQDTPEKMTLNVRSVEFISDKPLKFYAPHFSECFDPTLNEGSEGRDAFKFS